MLLGYPHPLLGIINAVLGIMIHRYSGGAASEPLLHLPDLRWLGPWNDLSQEE